MTESSCLERTHPRRHLSTSSPEDGNRPSSHPFRLPDDGESREPVAIGNDAQTRFAQVRTTQRQTT